MAPCGWFSSWASDAVNSPTVTTRDTWAVRSVGAGPPPRPVGGVAEEHNAPSSPAWPPPPPQPPGNHVVCQNRAAQKGKRRLTSPTPSALTARTRNTCSLGRPRQTRPFFGRRRRANGLPSHRRAESETGSVPVWRKLGRWPDFQAPAGRKIGVSPGRERRLHGRSFPEDGLRTIRRLDLRQGLQRVDPKPLRIRHGGSLSASRTKGARPHRGPTSAGDPRNNRGWAGHPHCRATGRSAPRAATHPSPDRSARTCKIPGSRCQKFPPDPWRCC